MSVTESSEVASRKADRYSINRRIDAPTAAAQLDHWPRSASRGQYRQAVRESFADRHAKTFRKTRQHENIGI